MQDGNGTSSAKPSPLRVLMVENGRGGYTRYTGDLCAALTALGVDVVYLASRENTSTPDPRIRMHPVLFPASPRPRPRLTGRLGGVALRLIWSMRNLLSIHRFARRCNPDLIHLQTTTPMTYGLVLPLLHRHWPVILTAHDVLPHHGPRGLKSFAALRRLHSAVDHIIVHTDANRRLLLQRFGVEPQRVEVIPHGATGALERVDKQAARERLHLPPDAALVLSLGVLRKNKRLDLLIRATALALRQRGDIRLVIAGRPSSITAEQVTEMLRHAGLDTLAITRFDWLTDEAIGLYLNACDVCVLPYAGFDAQSGVLVQAMAHGTPVIVSDAGALAETVTASGAGVVFHGGNVDELTRRILDMLASESLRRRCAEGGRRTVERQLDWNIIAARTHETYRGVCAVRLHDGASVRGFA